MNTITPTQNFEKFIINNELYIDRTEKIYNLIANSDDFFLLGQKKEKTDYDFEQFPIIYISFAGHNEPIYKNDTLLYLNRIIKIYYNDKVYKLSDFENFDGITIGSLIDEIYFKFNKKTILYQFLIL